MKCFRTKRVRRIVALALAATVLFWLSAAIGDSGDIEYFSRSDDLPFADAVRVDDLLFLSGMIGIKPDTTELAAGGIEAEARQTMDNIKATLERHGYGMKDLVKCTVMLADISEWETFNEVYRTYFDERFPARSAFGTSGLALDARVEVECIAAGKPADQGEP